RGFVRAKPAADRLAVVVFGNTATQLTDFSSARIDADAALRELELAPLQGTALYDAVVMSANALASQALPGRVLILLTDGSDQGSKVGLEAAVKAVRDAGVVVYPIAIVSEQFSAAPLERLAKESGGTYYPAASTASLSAIYAKIAEELGRTWRLEYVTAARPGDTLHLSAKVAGVGTATSGVTLPGAEVGVAAEKPSPLLPQHLYSSSAGTLLVAGVVGFLSLLAIGIALAVRKGTRLRNRIEAHVAPTTSTDRKKLRPRERFGAAAGLFRATENAFGHLNAWRKLQRTIERADLPLRTVEFIYIAFGSSLLFGLVAAVAAAATPVILLGFAIGFTLPLGFLWFKAKRRLNAFENQLPDLLITMAASLKAGHSFRQGIQTVVDEGQAPAADEFKRVLTETRLGRPMDDALNEMAERVGSKNLDFVITCVTIQRQVGGSLAGLFDMVAEAVRQRQQFARKIRSLTAMGRMSAYVLCGLPFFVAGTLTVINGEYMSPLYNTSTGNLLIAIGLCMMAVGSLFLRKIVSFRG
ncbi:MAG: type II secretion system F family protein, partial [Actinomycetota bacterium]|nr:type II secretion system F family protein [Actinomycetota bacterium]